MNRYSIKMRASNKEEGHISGAEKLVPEEELELYCARLLARALRHSKGKPDFINLKIEAVAEEEILRLPALKVTTVETSNAGEGLDVVRGYLDRLGLKRGEEILALWGQGLSMRCAMLLDADSLQRLSVLSFRQVQKDPDIPTLPHCQVQRKSEYLRRLIFLRH